VSSGGGAYGLTDTWTPVSANGASAPAPYVRERPCSTRARALIPVAPASCAGVGEAGDFSCGDRCAGAAHTQCCQGQCYLRAATPDATSAEAAALFETLPSGCDGAAPFGDFTCGGVVCVDERQCCNAQCVRAGTTFRPVDSLSVSLRPQPPTPPPPPPVPVPTPVAPPPPPPPPQPTAAELCASAGVAPWGDWTCAFVCANGLICCDGQCVTFTGTPVVSRPVTPTPTPTPMPTPPAVDCTGDPPLGDLTCPMYCVQDTTCCDGACVSTQAPTPPVVLRPDGTIDSGSNSAPTNILQDDCRGSAPYGDFSCAAECPLDTQCCERRCIVPADNVNVDGTSGNNNGVNTSPTPTPVNGGGDLGQQATVDGNCEGSHEFGDRTCPQRCATGYQCCRQQCRLLTTLTPPPAVEVAQAAPTPVDFANRYCLRVTQAGNVDANQDYISLPVPRQGAFGVYVGRTDMRYELSLNNLMSDTRWTLTFRAAAGASPTTAVALYESMVPGFQGITGTYFPQTQNGQPIWRNPITSTAISGTGPAPVVAFIICE
jgi:hypothetical protein